MVNGFALGGFSKGLNASRDSAARERVSQTGQLQAENNAARQQTQDTNAAISNSVQFAASAIESLQKAGKSSQEILGVLEPVIEDITSLGDSAGVNTQAFITALNAKAQTPVVGEPTERQKITQKLENEVFEKSERERLGLDGADKVDLNDLTKGEIQVDKEFAKELVSFDSRGGFADVRKNLQQLKSVRERLVGNDTLTGPLIGSVPDVIGGVINPEAIDVRENVEEVVQRNLKLILGAQFTEREGERLIARAFNPKLQEGVNIKRLDRLIGQIESAAEAKFRAVEYWQKNRTLKGFKGNLPSFSDFKGTENPSEIPTVNTPEEAAALPSGTKFRDPEGVLRMVP